jgi:hypothetical protein
MKTAHALLVGWVIVSIASIAGAVMLGVNGHPWLAALVAILGLSSKVTAND